MPKKQRLERRLERLQGRLKRLEALEASDQLGPVMTFVSKMLAEAGEDLDDDNDGEVEFEEVADGLADRIDGLLGFAPRVQAVIDTLGGPERFAKMAAAIHTGRPKILRRRIARTERKLAALQG